MTLHSEPTPYLHWQCALYPQHTFFPILAKLSLLQNFSLVGETSYHFTIKPQGHISYCLLPTPYHQLLTPYCSVESEVHRPHSWGMGAAPGQRLIFSYTAKEHPGVHCRPAGVPHSVICLIQVRPALPAAGIGHGGGLRVNVTRLSQASGLWIGMLAEMRTWEMTLEFWVAYVFEFCKNYQRGINVESIPS